MRVVSAKRNAVDVHWSCDVFDLLLAQIRKAEIDLVAHLVAHDPADADPARLGQRLQPRGDIDAVAVNVILLEDDVAKIDADAKLDAAFLGDAVIAQRHLALQFDRAAHCIDDARKLGQQPVAGSFDDATAMLGDLGVRHFAAQRRQGSVRALLVLAHQPRIAHDIGRQDRRQPTLDALSLPSIHGVILPFVEHPVLHNVGNVFALAVEQ
jgi:hypothetical protein